MFDFSWPEMAIIAVVALVVIGPKDLPRVLRTAGQWVRRARAIAREFQGNLEQMVREAELDEVKEQLKKTASFDLETEIAKTIDPAGELKSSLSDEPAAKPHAETIAIEPPLADPTSLETPAPDAVLPDSAATHSAVPDSSVPDSAAPEVPVAETDPGRPSEPPAEPHEAEPAEAQEAEPADRHARTGA